MVMASRLSEFTSTLTSFFGYMHVSVKVEDTVLKINFDGACIYPKNDVRVEVNSDNLDAITIRDGAGLLSGTEINTRKFTLTADDARELELTIDAEFFRINCLGGSVFRLGGEVEELEIAASDGCGILGYGLAADSVNLFIDSGAYVQTYPLDELSVDLENGSVYYMGEPFLKQKLDDFSSIEKTS
jgi:hypothetical protein